ncbi:MAG: ABC transporter permease [Anaerolineae bacterium]|nr:ABC transporter permease [Anaerolineae bacterium]
MATTLTAPKASSSTLDNLASLAARFWSYIFLAALIIFFSTQAPGFFTVRNFSSVLVTGTLVTLMAVGQTYVIITAGIDLSIAWTVGLASVIAARTMRDMANGGTDVGIAITCGVILGLLVSLIPGIINGILVAKIKVPPFIATLGMYGIVRGAAFLLTDGQQVVGNLPANVREVLRSIGGGSLIYNLPGQGLSFFTEPANIPQAQLRDLQSWLPYPVLVTIIVLIIFGFLLGRTQFGRHTYAIGGSKDAAIRAGINVDRHLILIYVICAFTAGIAGVLHVFRFTAGAPQAGEAALLDSVAAVVIGGTNLFGGEGRVRGAVVGALIFGVLQTGLVMLNIASLWQFVIVGIVIIIAVLVNNARALLERRRTNV